MFVFDASRRARAARLLALALASAPLAPSMAADRAPAPVAETIPTPDDAGVALTPGARDGAGSALTPGPPSSRFT